MRAKINALKILQTQATDTMVQCAMLIFTLFYPKLKQFRLNPHVQINRKHYRLLEIRV